MGIYNKLMEIQQELNVPKGQYNSFSKYYYRSCEDILDAAKPVCAKHGCVLIVGDEVTQVGDRYYVKATATLHDTETGEQYQNYAYAREEETKKGMDGAQVTGTSSSYARKYALCGLFALDDGKDPDALPPSENKPANKPTGSKTADKVNSKQLADLQVMAKKKGVTVESIVNGYNLSKLEDMDIKQWAQAMNGLRKRADV